MKFLPLIWKNMMRKKVRTIFTVLSILIAFVLFGYLGAIRLAFSLGVDVTGADRLLVIHRVSLIRPLPLAHMNRIRSVPGVVDVTHATWFGGKYQDQFEGRFAILPVEPEQFLGLYPEFLVSEEHKKSWMANRTGVLVGRKTADDFGWKVGDRVPIQDWDRYREQVRWRIIPGVY